MSRREYANLILHISPGEVRCDGSISTSIHIMKENGFLLQLFSNLNIKIVGSQDFLVDKDIHHNPAFFEFKLNNYKSANFNNIQFNFKLADYVRINDELNNVNWNNVLKYDNVNNNLDAFYDLLFKIIENYVPKIKFCNSNFPRWYSYELKNLVCWKIGK